MSGVPGPSCRSRKIPAPGRYSRRAACPCAADRAAETTHRTPSRRVLAESPQAVALEARRRSRAARALRLPTPGLRPHRVGLVGATSAATPEVLGTPTRPRPLPIPGTPQRNATRILQMELVAATSTTAGRRQEPRGT